MKLLKKVLSERNVEGESLFDIIRNIIREEFKIHESNIKELLNSNVNKTTERLDKLSAKIVDLTASLEFTQKKIDEELFQVKKDIKNLKTEVKAIEDDLLNAEEVSAKLIKLEERSLRNNFRIDGIKEEPNETWEACEKKIQNIIEDKLGIDSDVEIDRCHRIGPRKTKTGQNRDRSRTVICRLNRLKEKQRILNNVKKLKNTGIYIYEDFSKDTMELRKFQVGTSFGISQTKQSRMPKLQEHHSKGSQWCKINIDLFIFF